MIAAAPPIPEQRPAYAIPPGYGFHRLSARELRDRESLMDLLQIYELPRKNHRYVMGVDVSDGLGLDRSVAAVVRMGTVDEPEEEVAQFVSDSTSPYELAYIVEAIGLLYKWPDGLPAMAAIECNNHGLSVQDTLKEHLGYSHFYIWEVLDQADPGKRFTTRIGWMTTPRTRPILLDQFHSAVTRVDPLTGYSDLRLNSPFTIDELRDFQTDGALWEAEAARGAYDDCIVSTAIAHYVAWRLMGGENEPLADRRRRRREEDLRRARLGMVEPVDFRNSDSSATEQKAQQGTTPEVEPGEDDDGEWFYDPDARGHGGTLY